MTAVLFVAAAFALGLFLGALVSVARDYMDEQAAQDAERDQATRLWREGYAHGWTSGRVQLVDEQEAKRHHPTSHPLGEVIRIEHARKDELDDLWGTD
jgi:hypothetical protein